jgi:RimJ/RimL family protein N-acetyltransferase
LHDIQRILGNSAVVFYSGCSPFSVEQSTEWLLNHIRHYSDLNSLGVFALERKDSKVVIGYCGLEPLPKNISDSVEVTVGLEHKHWGKGYAVEAVSSIIEYAFHDCGLDRVVAVVHVGNKSALHLVEKFGFQQKDKLTMEGVGPHILFSLETPNKRIQTDAAQPRG